MTNEINNLVKFGFNIKNAIQLACLLSLSPRDGRLLLVTDGLITQRKVMRVLESKKMAFDIFTNDRPSLLKEGAPILLITSHQMLMGIRISEFAGGAFLEEGPSSKRSELVRGKIKNSFIAKATREGRSLTQQCRSRRLARKNAQNRIEYI